MPRDSLKKLLAKFPYFFDKRDVSNFYRSQDVTNRRFQDVYQSLYSVCESFHLEKRCCIWREQSVDFEYVINFVANYPNLKSVTLLKNDEVIYMEQYEYDDEVNAFFYSYNGSCLNDSSEEQVDEEGNILYNIIPESQFKIIVETYDEYQIIKGYPENDSVENDEYDHDHSLDRFGELLKIPRKKYLIVDNDLYPLTEPPYNNQSSEDDYHYMNRILNYNLLYHSVPLPVLEIWKEYGFLPTMENRSKYLLKMFDITQHSNYVDDTQDQFRDYIKKGDRWFVGSWMPKQWEHKDVFLDEEVNEDVYFFANSNVNVAIGKNKIILNFQLLDSLGANVDVPFTVNVFKDNELYKENVVNNTLIIPSDDINDSTLFTMYCYVDDVLVGEDTVNIIRRDCRDSDFFISPSGNNFNSGKTWDDSFKDIKYCVDNVERDGTIISVDEGGDYVDNVPYPIDIVHSMTIQGCKSDVVINQAFEKIPFFRIFPGKKLVLSNIYLGSNFMEYVEFENNSTSEVLNVISKRM